MSFRLSTRPLLNASPLITKHIFHVRPFRLSRGFRGYLAVGFLVYTAGVASVFAGGYALYSLSGLKKTIDTYSPALKYLGLTRQQLLYNQVPSNALAYLRKAAKAYVAYIPGAGFIVDRTFDHIDTTVDTHAEEANAIIKQAYDDIAEIVKQGGNRHEMYSGFEVLNVCRRLLHELATLGIKAGKPISESFTAVAGTLVETMKSKSPEWEQSLDKGVSSVSNKIRSIFGPKDSK